MPRRGCLELDGVGKARFLGWNRALLILSSARTMMIVFMRGTLSSYVCYGTSTHGRGAEHRDGRLRLCNVWISEHFPPRSYSGP
jgi:hypothetical protein